jgi:hypothetical protein
MPNEPLIQIDITPEFKQNLRALSKKYHRLN